MSAQGRLERVLQVDTRHLPPARLLADEAPPHTTRHMHPQNPGCWPDINCRSLQSVLVAEYFDTFKSLGQGFGIPAFIQLDHQPDFVG